MFRRAYSWRCRGVGGTSIGKRLSVSQSGDEDATTKDAATTPSNKRKILSPLEVFFQPFWSTTQEKHLLKELYSTTSNVIVISSFRGCRKSTTAERLAKRLKYRHIGMGLWPWIMQVEHVRDYADYEGKFDKEKPFLNSLFSAAMQFLRNLILVFGCCVPFHVVSVWWCEESLSLPDFWGHVVSRLPGREDMLVLVVTLFLAGSFTFHKKVVVVDDLLTFKFSGKAEGTAHNVKCALDRLKSLANKGCRIVILSSNEGIGELFTDSNPSTYMTATFPKASDEEMVKALQRCKFGTTSAEFEHAKQLYAGIPHHLYSTRWWFIVAEHLELPQIPRTVLFTVALKLDLMCQPVAHHFALAYSQEVDVARALKNLFTEPEVAEIVRIYGPRGPRRLVLTAGLLITGRDVRLQGRAAMNLSLQERTVAELQEQFKMIPDAANQEALTKEEAKVQHLKNYIEQRLAVKVYEAAVAAAEAEFGNAVRRVLEAGPDTFKDDEKCQKEIDRIKGLLI